MSEGGREEERRVEGYDIVLCSVWYRDVQSLLGCIGVEAPEVGAMDCVAHCRRMLALLSTLELVKVDERS